MPLKAFQSQKTRAKQNASEFIPVEKRMIPHHARTMTTQLRHAGLAADKVVAHVQRETLVPRQPARHRRFANSRRVLQYQRFRNQNTSIVLAHP